MLLKNKLTREFLYQKYIIEKKSMPKIARELGYGSSTIWRYLKKHNIPTTKEILNNLLTKKLLYQKYIVEKKSTNEIAKELGTNHNKILFYLRRHNILRRNTGELNIGRHPSEETNKKHGESIKGVKHWNYGKRVSEETRRKQSESRNRRVFPIKDTKIEVKLQNELNSKGYLFIKHYPIIGQPDIVFPLQKIAIFCDGDYWHANPSKYKPEYLIHGGKNKQTAQERWSIDNNISKQLEEKGWKVLRFWETDIKKDVREIINIIENELDNQRHNIVNMKEEEVAPFRVGSS